MKVSARTRYALRLLVYLALRGGGRLIQVGEVARQERIPAKFLEQIIRSLKKAGLLRVERGAHGGYALARDPAEISVGQIFAALDDDFSSGSGDDSESGPGPGAIDDFWNGFEGSVKRYLAGVSVADLAQRQLDKSMLMSFYI